MTNPTGPNGVPEQLSHYRLGRLLGRGGMGSVYEAIDRRSDVKVAVKLLNPNIANDESFQERFEREAHIAALLRSPYTVQLLDYGFSHNHFFLVMEFVEGTTLRDALHNG